MQAIVQDRYGAAEVLESEDIDRPEIGDGDVLVRVRAASIHVGDVIVRVRPRLRHERRSRPETHSSCG